jgi:hypothetical protein
VAAPRRPGRPRQPAQRHLVKLDSGRLARQWAQELPAAFARRLADALRQGPLAVEQLQGSAVLPNSAYVVHLAAELARQGDGSYTAGMLTTLLDTRRTSRTSPRSGPDPTAADPADASPSQYSPT